MGRTFNGIWLRSCLKGTDSVLYVKCLLYENISHEPSYPILFFTRYLNKFNSLMLNVHEKVIQT